MLARVALLVGGAVALALSGATSTPVQAQPIGDLLYRSWSSALPASLFSQMEASCRQIFTWETANTPVLKDAKRVTRWLPVGQEPRFPLEEAVLHLARLAQPDASLVGYEWWIQQIAEQGPLSFHVDKDEAVASNEHYLLHPLWSSVFYVTNEGGGTLITNQLSPSGNGYEPLQPVEGAWSFPEANKFLRFNGTLLHGVVPGQQRGPFAKERITFLVNFWHVRPKAPNCVELPHEQVTGLKLWTKQELAAVREGYKSDAKPTPQPLRVVDVRPSARRSGRTETYPFTMELPGHQRQDIFLPKLEPKGGETYYLHWASSKSVFERAQRKMRKALHASGELIEDQPDAAEGEGKKGKKKGKKAPRRRSEENEEEDAAPRRRKKKSGRRPRRRLLEDDDSLDEPRRAKKRSTTAKRRASPDDDDDDDEEEGGAPRKRRRPRRADDEDDEPRRRRAAAPKKRAAGNYEQRYEQAQRAKKEIKDRWRIQ